MNDGLVKFREGTVIAPQLTAKAWNAMVDAIRRNWIRPGPNTLMNQDSGGTQLWGSPTRVTRNANYPRTLLIYDASTTGSPGVSCTPGQINNVSPKIGGVSIGAATPPILSVVTGNVYLHATVNSDLVITALVIENAASTPADTTTEYYLNLAEVTVASGHISLLNPVSWNVMGLQICGGQGLWGGFGS